MATRTLCTLRNMAQRVEHPIHVLGVGNLGNLFAHSIKKQSPDTPVTLLLHREGLLQDWEERKGHIECIRDDISDRRSGFEVELVSGPRPDDASSGRIKHLIVATKTYNTVAALEPIKNRLDPESSILFLQNGMGTTDEVSNKLFPNVVLRPRYWAGIVSAGIYGRGPFSIVHAGSGSLTIGMVGEHSEASSEPADDPMLQHVLEAKDLSATLVTPRHIRAVQLRKLAANATINPMTALLNCTNGEAFSTDARMEFLRRLLVETADVLRALLPPELDADTRNEFSNDSLMGYVLQVAEKTAKNSSSMRQDFRAGRGTEIDYINGYIVAQAQKLGIPVVYHSQILSWVRSREHITDETLEGFNKVK